jgi:hypothetical protein
MAGQPKSRAKRRDRDLEKVNPKVNPTTEAKRLFERVGKTEPITDPILALEELAGQTMALVESLRGVVTTLKTIRYRDAQGKEQLRAELSVYLAALQQAESILGRIVVLDLDERRVRVVERRRKMQRGVADSAITHVLSLVSDLGLDAADLKVRLALEAFLRKVGADQDDLEDVEDAEVVEVKELPPGDRPKKRAS